MWSILSKNAPPGAIAIKTVPRGCARDRAPAAPRLQSLLLPRRRRRGRGKPRRAKTFNFLKTRYRWDIRNLWIRMPVWAFPSWPTGRGKLRMDTVKRGCRPSCALRALFPRAATLVADIPPNLVRRDTVHAVSAPRMWRYRDPIVWVPMMASSTLAFACGQRRVPGCRVA